MDYRLTKKDLLETIRVWNNFLNKKVHLIACGGTALTLLDIKSSTKDVDLIVPEESEHDYLVGVLKNLGYKSATGWGWQKEDGFIFELFRGNKVHTTNLLENPLIKGNHIVIKEFSHIYLGTLNYYDIIITKLFRGTSVDIDDCKSLVREKRKDLNLDLLKDRFLETASYDVSGEKVKENLTYFMKILKQEKIYE